MASVNIHAEHRDILDALITSRRTSSVAGSTKTGPFYEQRDAYVFAASIGLALRSPTPVEKMPTSRKGVTPIRDSVFLGADGALQLCHAVCLLDEREDESLAEALGRQLSLIAPAEQAAQFELLDRYAHAGFSWLERRKGDESTIRDLILAAIDQIERVSMEEIDTTDVSDPLLDLFDMKL